MEINVIILRMQILKYQLSQSPLEIVPTNGIEAFKVALTMLSVMLHLVCSS